MKSATEDGELLSAPSGFIPPDFRAPLDVSAHLDAVPTGATLKGMFFQDLADQLAAAGHDTSGRSFSAFRDYPTRDYLTFLVEASKKLHPKVPLREGLRRLGRSAYPTFAETRIGKVVFGVVGGNLPAIMRLAGKAYRIADSVARADAVEVTDAHARMLLKSVYVFVDAYQVGVFEGAVLAARRVPEVAIRPVSLHEAELLVVWH